MSETVTPLHKHVLACLGKTIPCHRRYQNIGAHALHLDSMSFRRTNMRLLRRTPLDAYVLGVLHDLWTGDGDGLCVGEQGFEDSNRSWGWGGDNEERGLQVVAAVCAGSGVFPPYLAWVSLAFVIS